MALTPVMIIVTTVIALFIIVMFVWFSWVVLGFRKIWYEISKKKQINQVLDLLYDNENNHMFKHEKVEKYIQLGFYNPVIFEIAERKFYNQRKQLNKLNTEKQYERTKQAPKQFRKVESFEVPYEKYAEPEEYATAEFTPNLPPAPTRARGRNGYANEPRAIPRAPARANARVEPTADISYPARAPTNRQAPRQRDLQIRGVEKPSKKSRYFN